MKKAVKKLFGRFNGQDVYSYTFETDSGYRLTSMPYGATILDYITPDKNGKFANINLRFANLEDYLVKGPKFGASVGPVAGRIGEGTFELNGKTYHLPQNNKTNNMHSGLDGIHVALFETAEVDDHSVTFYTERADGFGGFPGPIKIWIRHSLAENGELTLTYEAAADQDTLFNPTNHAYFNLSGDQSRLIDDFQLTINAAGYYPLDENSLPAEEIDSRAGFVQELMKGASVGSIRQSDHPQILLAGGIDHPFALDRDQEVAAEYYDPESGRLLRVRTDRSCLIVYTANNYNDFTKSKGHPAHNGLALEAQAVPDAIHRAEKDQVILKAGQVMKTSTSYHATVKQ
ncbi:galactose mutarotase [Streptococcus chenjunshii]|uniref:Aldose 1-epimerase n=1 Tax=Streptococcus chenjunshii TaxID=2173853 RepID=A0A372KQM4_9STRE|nr:aldose epimerase family protein [Streptococcus chenjunshii]AXQ77897.1 galactose mutarotase [Streptococcus chenjunshii]RFU51860.1 galactose mutarotase [Streptococcus chenjunshii]RFU53948.1 galactose mutarotase [Streptococcus chenjunshii]